MRIVNSHLALLIELENFKNKQYSYHEVKKIRTFTHSLNVRLIII